MLRRQRHIRQLLKAPHHDESTLEQTISDTHYRVKAEYERSSKKFMRAMVRSDQPLRILDIGCGTGHNAMRLAGAQGHDVYGIDLSPVAIAQYQAKGLQGSVMDVEADAIALPPGIPLI